MTAFTVEGFEKVGGVEDELGRDRGWSDIGEAEDGVEAERGGYREGCPVCG